MAKVKRKKRGRQRFTINDLTLELLSHIFSFLEKPWALWTLRMVSRDFRAAANLSVSCLNLCKGMRTEGAQIRDMTCSVSAQLLDSLHERPQDLEDTLPALRSRCRCQGGLKLGHACYGPGFLHHVTKAELWPNRVFERDTSTGLESCKDALCPAPQHVPLEVALAHMPKLQSLRLHPEISTPAVSALTNITCLSLSHSHANQAYLAALADSRALKSLNVQFWGNDDVPLGYSAELAQAVCSPAFSHLRALQLDLDVAHVSHLSGLTCLTNLFLSLGGLGDPHLGTLAVLTGLQSLTITCHLPGEFEFEDTDSDDEDDLSPFEWSGWPFLGALKGLTSLTIFPSSAFVLSGSDVLPLTCLTRLQTLTLGIAQCIEPSYQENLPLPRELAFLGTATALEELDLGLNSKYIPALTPSAYTAVQDVLRRLTRLTSLYLDFGTSWEYQPPNFGTLELFACVPSLRVFKFPDKGSPETPTGAPQAGLLAATTQLRSLTALSWLHPPHIVSLLDSLNPPLLTHLCLSCDSLSPPVIQSILRHTKLRALALRVVSLSVDTLQQLPLTGLTKLRLEAETSEGPALFGWRSLEREPVEALLAQLNRQRNESGWPPIKTSEDWDPYPLIYC
eukprot:jgi/Botrbrau1/14620/Bobra.0364s0004.1